MKLRNRMRIPALLLCAALCLSLLSGVRVYADGEIWTEAPTGWRHWSHVISRREDGHLCNWGVRGETALFLSGNALSYYYDNEWGVGMSWGAFAIADYPGGSGTEDAIQSPLYGFLHSFLLSKQTHVTDYAETRSLYRYTDCMVSDSEHISSFYSGIKLNGAWDSGATWNREHTWPKSKASGSQNGDIMMLRPTSVRENSSRGNTAYGESAGFYNPNCEAGNTGLDLRGDCARICLYCYVRWSENAGNMWGRDGVMESLDVLLDWMEQDPVDTWEMGRNDAAEDITGVRNCFVDYPELAWALFGRESPADYPTPMNGGQEWPPASAVGVEFTAVPDDPNHGSVEVFGLAAIPTPAEGYYASGYDVSAAGPYYVDPEDPYPYQDVFRWDHGRLLCMVTWEFNASVVIHFTPIGEEDPCPLGHDLDRENPEILLQPTCTENGLGRLTCKRCGKTTEQPLFALGHDWDDGVVTVPPTIYDNGTIVYTCRRCGESWDSWLMFSFDDVSDPEKYYYGPVYWALYHDPQITVGTDPTHFSPNKPCTREQIMTFVWKACGAPEPESTENPFQDVKDKYYKPAVLWAYYHEPQITGGMNATTFGVGQPCTRAQVVMFLWAAAGKPEPTTTENPFSDVKTTDYFYSAVLWAVETGVTGGTSPTTFSPKQTCTRAQVVTFLYAAVG